MKMIVEFTGDEVKKLRILAEHADASIEKTVHDAVTEWMFPRMDQLIMVEDDQ